MKNIYSSLDIGTNTIKLVVAEMYNNKLNILNVNEITSKGIKNALIVNAEEVLICLKELFRRTEDTLGIKIKKVITTIPSYYSEFSVGEGYTTINRDNSIVEGIDIIRALQSSVYNRIDDNRELVSVVPIEFTLDDKIKLEDPKGKKASKLSVTSIFSTVPKKNIYGIITLLEDIGVEVVDINLNATCDFYELKNDDLKDKTGAIINIGKDKTEVSIINKNILIATENILIGGKNIDKDISYIYNINTKLSNTLKETFALSSKRNASMREIETFRNNDNEEVKINQYEISEIVNSRLTEILNLSKKQINLLTKKEIHYIIVTGGTSELSDFDSVASDIFGKLYINTEVKEIGVRHNKYSTALGGIKFYYDKLTFRNKISSTMDEEQQELLFKIKRDRNINSDTVLGKVFSYFFDN